MALTIEELKDRIAAQVDPDDIVELLDISSEELLERFTDKVEEKYNGLCKEFTDEEAEPGSAGTAD